MGKLTTQDRKHLATSSFAVPSKAPGSGSYPIPDASHARNALARAAQHGSPAVKAQVAAKVHQKFPDIGKRASPPPANSGAGAPKATSPARPKAPAPDTRSQSSAFVAPPASKGSPPPPPMIAKGFAGHPNGPASGMESAMQAHADKMHPTGKGR